MRYTKLLPILAFMTLTSTAIASDYEITLSQLSLGGAAVPSTTGEYSINGTIGQFAPGSTGNGLGYTIEGGFWPSIEDAPPCRVDMNGDGDLNFFDVSQFLAGYLSNDPTSDFNDDGQFNFFDVSVFLTEFQSGCP